jgi:predicted metal-binding protein
MIDDALKALAAETGFSHAGALDAASIQLREEVRDMCAENKCKAFNTNWSCPPACGTLAECGARLRLFRRGIILQTSGCLEDSFDYEAMERLGREHASCMAAFSRKIKPFVSPVLMLGAGACRRCETCSYPGAPCRFPDEMFSSMEAYGMVVSDVCRDNGMRYYYGPNTLTYVGCVLFNASP